MLKLSKPRWREQMPEIGTPLVCLPMEVEKQPTRRAPEFVCAGLTQHGFRLARIMVSAQGEGQWLGQMYVGTELSFADPVDLAMFTPTAFGVRLRAAAEPGTIIRFMVRWVAPALYRLTLAEYCRWLERRQPHERQPPETPPQFNMLLLGHVIR